MTEARPPVRILFYLSILSHKPRSFQVVLTVAGTDPSGGAGIQVCLSREYPLTRTERSERFRPI
jgi:hypothetical protein